MTSKSRLPSAPEIPTVDEAGLAGFYFLNWHAIWAPRGTPDEMTVKTQCCGSQDLGGSIDLEAARRHRSADAATRATDGRSPRDVSERRDREVVANHQGGRDTRRSRYADPRKRPNGRVNSRRPGEFLSQEECDAHPQSLRRR